MSTRMEVALIALVTLVLATVAVAASRVASGGEITLKGRAG
ncbi:hypothetical protein [Candidatus Palauibacter sp.]